LSETSCPAPLRDYPNIVAGHGGGGQLSSELVEHLFLPAFDNEMLANLADSAVLPATGQRLAFSTDSFVVRPLFFPGGSIAELAVNGTVNDVAMSGAQPVYLSAGFILEEGFPVETLSIIARRMAEAARLAGVNIVTGDTKVVEKGHGDGCYINTSGIGLLADGLHLGPDQARPGDAVIISGTIGDHGMAVMSVREGLEFESVIESDTAALNGLVAKMLERCTDIHALRDPTRGGVASALNEIAAKSNVGIELDEANLPVTGPVQSACEFLGLDPLFVANEGKVIAIAPQVQAEGLVQSMRQHPLGCQAAIIEPTVAQDLFVEVAEVA
jgi:hydrogenase expression/formation protein HypE